MSRRPRVEILIDELVLHGFSSADRYAVGEALQQELGRLVADTGTDVLSGLQDASRLRAENIQLTAGARPDATGRQVAGAVHASLGLREGRGVK